MTRTWAVQSKTYNDTVRDITSFVYRSINKGSTTSIIYERLLIAVDNMLRAEMLKEAYPKMDCSVALHADMDGSARTSLDDSYKKLQQTIASVYAFYELLSKQAQPAFWDAIEAHPKAGKFVECSAAGFQHESYSLTLEEQLEILRDVEERSSADSPDKYLIAKISEDAKSLAAGVLQQITQAAKDLAKTHRSLISAL